MLTVKILTPQEAHDYKDVDLVLLPGDHGEIGILEHHINMVSILEPGVVRVYHDAKIIANIFIFGGIVELSNDVVSIMTEKASIIEKLDVEMAKKNLVSCQEEQKNADYDSNKKLFDDVLLYSRIIETSQKH